MLSIDVRKLLPAPTSYAPLPLLNSRSRAPRDNKRPRAADPLPASPRGQASHRARMAWAPASRHLWSSGYDVSPTR